VQRFGDALNVNLHFHTLVLDGVFVADRNDMLRFRALAAPSDRDIERTTRRIARSLRRLLLERGIATDQESNDSDELDNEGAFFAGLYAASGSSRVALGPRAGRGVVRIREAVDPEQAAFFPGPRCANIDGISLRDRRARMPALRRSDARARNHRFAEDSRELRGQPVHIEVLVERDRRRIRQSTVKR